MAFIPFLVQTFHRKNKKIPHFPRNSDKEKYQSTEKSAKRKRLAFSFGTTRKAPEIAP
jgi:hypothetical protein